MAYYMERDIKINLLLKGHLSSPSPKLHIQLRFGFYSFLQPRRYATPEYVGYSAASAALPASLPYDGMRAAVREATGDHLLDYERVRLVEAVRSEVLKSFPAGTLPEHEVLLLCFDVQVVHRREYFLGSRALGMIPAAASSLALLEEYEVDCRGGEEEEERGCCICLEEIGRGGDGGGALRMPCAHVFHGGCIEEWLRQSRYCPLCCYEMPRERSWRFSDFFELLTSRI